MTNELETKLIGWLETSAQAIGDFASKEVPPFIHEYLQWKFLECFYTPCMALLGFLVFGLIMRKCWKKYKTDNDPALSELYQGGAIFSAISLFTIFLIFILSSLKNIPTAIQIKVAPKVYLMEKATELIKSK
jgi:hypothetical protein